MDAQVTTTSVMFVPDDKAGNPYQTLLAKSLEQQNVRVDYLNKHLSALVWLALGRIPTPQIVHIHWLDAYIVADRLFKTLLKTVLTLLCIVLLKLRGRKVFYTLHNLQSHESPYPKVERWFYRCFFRLVDGVFAHCGSAVKLLGEAYGSKLIDKTSIVPHGNYIGVYPEGMPRLVARQRLGLAEDKLVLLSVGQIRPYKGIIELLNAFREIDDDNIELIIAGKVASDREALLSLVAQDPRVTMREGFVSEPDLALLFSAADVFVAPFKKVLTSGSVVLAMSYGLPCVAPAVGCLPETLQSQRDLLYKSDEPGALQQALRRVSEHRQSLDAWGRSNHDYARDELDWTPIGHKAAMGYAGRTAACEGGPGCNCQ